MEAWVREEMLQQRWGRFMHHVGAPPSADGIFRTVLVPLYNEPHRKYHTLEHIEACLFMFDTHVPKSVVRRSDIELAIWFHDLVYYTTSGTNEEESANLLLHHGKLNRFNATSLENAVKLVLATKKHEFPPNMSEEMGLFLDIDLSILGAKDEVFDKYERAIREEYAWVPTARFAEGRIAILKSFLDRDWVFATKEFRRLYEGQARSNIKRSIAALGGR